jgi:hypothetical protein
VVYLSTGGGGDREAEAILCELVTAAAGVPEARFVIGAGLLYRGREWSASNVTWTRRPVLVECFRAFDAAITAGGFNSVWELMHCGIPCLFLPRPRGWDNQEARVARCVEGGAGVLLPSREPEVIQAGLRQLLDPQEHARRAAAAMEMLPHNHALAAAEEILALVLDRGRVEDALTLVDPAALFTAQRAGIPERDLLRVAAFLHSRTTGARDEAAGEAAVAEANRLLRHLHARGGATRHALAVLKKVEQLPTADEIADRAIELWEAEKDL